MRRFLLALTLMLTLSTTATAQVSYNADVFGVAKINNIKGGYGSMTLAMRTNVFSISAAPVAFLWTDSTAKFNPNVELALKTPKSPLYVGVGRTIFSDKNNTYAVATLIGPSKFPLTVRGALGNDYRALSVGFFIQ